MVVLLSAGRFALTSLGSTSHGWTSHGRTTLRAILCPPPAFPGFIPGGFPAVVGIRRVCEKVLRGLGHAGLYPLRCAVLPATWSAGLTAPRPGAEGLPSQLRYHAKVVIAEIWRIGLFTSYKPSATQKRHTFSLKHDVCPQKGSKGAADMHVCYMTCHLYSYVQNMWFHPCNIARNIFLQLFFYLQSFLAGRGYSKTWFLFKTLTA